jgi:hypothetical protein
MLRRCVDSARQSAVLITFDLLVSQKQLNLFNYSSVSAVICSKSPTSYAVLGISIFSPYINKILHSVSEIYNNGNKKVMLCGKQC